MNVLAFDTLDMSGERVLPPEQVRAMEQLRLLDASLRQRDVQTRQRLAARLRRARAAARRNGRRQGWLDGTRDAATAYAEDVRRWRDASARIESAVAKVLQEATLALPKSLLMDMQLRKCLAAVRGGPELRVYVNAAAYQSVLSLMREWSTEVQVPVYEVALAEYLPDGVCILETANAMVEGQVERELAVFCEQVMASLQLVGAQS
jgi:flagellar biosynthesis/type III secretory pathway protein FliH